MIKLKKINDILNLIGKYIRNNKNDITYLVTSINANKYKGICEIKYLIFNGDKVIISGTEEEIFKILLSWSVVL